MSETIATDVVLLALFLLSVNSLVIGFAAIREFAGSHIATALGSVIGRSSPHIARRQQRRPRSV